MISSPPPATGSTPAGPVAPPKLAVGSVQARALYELWSGKSVVVDSPPGAGKTTLVCELVHQLFGHGSGMSVVIATPTRRAAANLAGRLAEQLHSTTADAAGRVYLALSRPRPDEVRQGVATSAGTFGGSAIAASTVTVKTVAACALRPPAADLMIIDEAYQVTFDDLVRAASNSAQLLLVGDPGQIGPVVTTNTSPWDGARTEPHRRCPEVVSGYDDVVTFSLPCTYRVGPDTVDVIAPLYGFAFDSLRPDRWIVARNGGRLPDVGHIAIDPAPNTTHLGHMRQAAMAAANLAGSDYHEVADDGTEQVRKLTPRDIAVVVSHNSQSNGVTTLLDSWGLGEVTVGTADRLQGGQWAAVVAVDPVVGHNRISDHQLNLGRLCVMLSRHTGALLWLHDGRAEQLLGPLAEDGNGDAATGIQVRRRILARPAAYVGDLGPATTGDTSAA